MVVRGWSEGKYVTAGGSWYHSTRAVVDVLVSAGLGRTQSQHARCTVTLVLGHSSAFCRSVNSPFSNCAIPCPLTPGPAWLEQAPGDWPRFLLHLPAPSLYLLGLLLLPAALRLVQPCSGSSMGASCDGRGRGNRPALRSFSDPWPSDPS